jgi:hypothetical protein
MRKNISQFLFELRTALVNLIERICNSLRRKKMAADSNPIEKKSIQFENGHQATYISVTPETPVENILPALGLSKAKAVIMVCGSTKPFSGRLKNRLTELFSRGVAKAAKEKEAIIIDGGTKAGVIELMGLGVADRDRETSLIGVAPAGNVSF